MLKKLGLACTYTDHSIFIPKVRLNGPIMNIFIDNIKVMVPKGSGIIQYMKLELTIAFSIVNIGLINFHLELKLEKNREKQIIKLS